MNEQIQLLIFGLNDRIYALHLSQVRRVIRAVDVTPLPGAPDIVLGAIDLQGEILPLLDIRARFGFPCRSTGINDQFIIAQTTRRAVALAVDEVKSIARRHRESVVAARGIAGPLEQVEGIVQLEDGLVLIHDLERFLSLNEERELSDAMEVAHG